jgi:hypothetical protein
MDTSRFAHSLLFQCEYCDEPIAISKSTAERSLELVDSSTFDILCTVCGWSKTVLGFEARGHWVVTWTRRKSIAAPDREPDREPNQGEDAEQPLT